MSPDGPDAAAAAPQEPQAQVGTLLRLLLEQQLRKLHGNAKPHHAHALQLKDRTGANGDETLQVLTFDTSARCVAKQCCR